MTRLSMEQISRESSNHEISSANSLQLSHRAFSDVSCLSKFQNLEKLDLSYNCLTSLDGLSACVNLKWLQVFENKLATLKGIESLSKLTVLNAGRNKLEKMDELYALTNLRALILNDNNISSICKLDQMKHLNTLVLSRNPIRVIGCSLEKVTSMIKLSLSHCKLETIGSSLVACVDLKEARFSHNEITALPKELAKNVRLRTLDIGNNVIEKFSEIKVLSALLNLKNLNLLGNPIADNHKLVKKVRRLLPSIRIFNAKPIGSSSASEKVPGILSVHPTKHGSSLEVSRKRKEGWSKGDECGRKAPDESIDETVKNIAGTRPGRTSNNINSLADVDASGTKISQNSVVEAGDVFREFDDAEVSFADFVYSGKIVEELEGEKGGETLPADGKLLGGIVVRNSKKKKRDKGVDTSLHAMLSSKNEIGMGGVSTWDDL